MIQVKKMKQVQMKIAITVHESQGLENIQG